MSGRLIRLRPYRSVLMAGAASALLAVGCQSTSGPLTTPVAPAPRVLRMDATPMLGNVVVPPGLVESASIVSAGGGNIVAAGGGNIIAQGGGNLVASGGGNLVAAAGSHFDLAALDPTASVSPTASADYDLPVQGAVVTLRDPLTRQRLKWVPAVQTDSKGNFQFPTLPAGVSYIIEVDFITQAGRAPYRMLSYGKPNAGQVVPVTWCCTAMIDTMMSKLTPDNTGIFLNDAPPSLLMTLSPMLETAYAGLAPADFKLKQHGVIAAAATSVQTGADGTVGLTVPDVLDLQDGNNGRDTILGALPTTPVLAGMIQTLGARNVAPTASDQVDLAQAGASFDALTQAPPLVNGQFQLTLPPASPSPSPLPAASY